MNLGILSGNLVGGDREIRPVPDLTDDVEIRSGRFDHQNVRPFGFIKVDLPPRLAPVGRIELIGALVEVGGARRGRTSDRIPERPIVGGGELRRISQNAGVTMTGRVQRPANRTHPAIHHVRRGDQRNPAGGMQNRHSGEDVDCPVVGHIPAILGQETIVTVGGVGIERDVRDHDQLRAGGPNGPYGPENQPVFIERPGTKRILQLARQTGEKRHGRKAEALEAAAHLDQRSQSMTLHPGHRTDWVGIPPAFTDEKRGDQVIHPDGCLGYHPPKGGRVTQASGPLREIELERVGHFRIDTDGNTMTTRRPDDIFHPPLHVAERLTSRTCC